MSSRIIDRDSCAASWEQLSPDLVALLQSALDECVALDRVAIYVEMWPDTGRYICYPADPPSDGELADRDTEFLAQLSVPFWADAWLGISSDSADESAEYEQLTRQALKALIEAYNRCDQPSNGHIALYAFEFEGSEGVWSTTTDADHESTRKD